MVTDHDKPAWYLSYFALSSGILVPECADTHGLMADLTYEFIFNPGGMWQYGPVRIARP